MPLNPILCNIKRIYLQETIGEMGIYAYVTDTEGNTFGLWQSA